MPGRDWTNTADQGPRLRLGVAVAGQTLALQITGQAAAAAGQTLQIRDRSKVDDGVHRARLGKICSGI